jgi:hypothetical protein
MWPFGLLLFLALGGLAVGVQQEASRPCRPADVVTVYVPAGPDVCPEEDSCRLDYSNGRWVIIPAGDW